jgi:hypothetical protein
LLAGGNSAADPFCSGIMRRMSAGVLAQLVLRKPKWRPFMQPEGKTCGRHLRIHSRTSSWAVRGRTVPGWREVKVTGRSLRETRRRLAMATVKTEGARYCKAVAPWGVAWLGTFQGLCQTCGALCSRSLEVRIASAKMARYMGDRALTGTEKLAREGSQVSRSFERPPPGTIECMWG